MRIWCGIIAGVLLTVATASAEVIVEDQFDGGRERTPIAGTAAKKYADAKAPAGRNLPAGVWTKVAGFEWSDPFIPASWDSDHDYLNLGEDITGVAISLAGYNKGVLHIMADVSHTSANRQGGMALGFYSELTKPNTRGGEMAHFIGIKVSEVSAEAGNIQVWEDGKPVGQAVDLPLIEPGKFYTLQYDIDTTTGKLSNVKFDGKDIAGLESTKFTTAATAYAGVVQSGGQNGRGAMDNFQVSRQ